MVPFHRFSLRFRNLSKTCHSIRKCSAKAKDDFNVSLSNPDFFKRVIERFPPGDVKNGQPCWPLAFAYGSGVFKQPGNESKSNMKDFVLVVENSEEWHAQNLKLNPKDYAGKY